MTSTTRPKWGHGHQSLDGYNACPICGESIYGSMDTPISFVRLDSEGIPLEWDEDVDVEFSVRCHGDPSHNADEMQRRYEDDAQKHEPPVGH